MHSAQERLTRYPALEVADKRARLRNSLRLTAGPLAPSLNKTSSDADRAAAGLWRRDPGVWSRDASVQKTIAEHLGWMSSPALIANSIERLHARALPDGWRLRRAGRVWPPCDARASAEARRGADRRARRNAAGAEAIL